MSSIKVRAKVKGDVVEVKTLIKHEMETGQRKNSKTGETIPAHYIEEVVFEHKGQTVMTAYWGPAVSKNPYMSFRFAGGAKGDMINVTWRDNKGETDSLEAEIG